MRALVLVLAFLSILGVMAGCDSDPAGLPADQVSGRVTMLDGSGAPGGSTVYLVRDPVWMGMLFAVVDSTLTSFDGWFTFTGLQSRNQYRLVAGRYGTGDPSVWSHITPLSQLVQMTVDEKIDERIYLTLSPVTTGSWLTGSAFVYADPPIPAENALIKVWRLEGPDFAVVDSTRVAADGSFGFTDIATGNHVVSAESYVDVGDSPGLLYAFETPIFFVATPTGMTLDPFLLTDELVDKPAVYIYPETPGEFEVTLGLGRGVQLIASDPVYGEGWSVYVAEDGRIDDAYDYLFYELSTPRPDLPAEGWCLDGTRIEDELDALADQCGLNANETVEFVDYWSDRLPDNPHWLAYPVFDTDLDRWATLDVTPVPESVLRVWVFFVPSQTARDLPAPVLPTCNREGTTVIEWGGGMLQPPSV